MLGWFLVLPEPRRCGTGPEQAADRLPRGLQDPGEGSLPRQGEEEEEEEEKEAEE